MNNHQVLLTGANGFLGKSLLRNSPSNIDWTINLRDEPRSLSARYNLSKVIIGDLKNHKVIESCLSNVQTIVHVAAKVPKNNQVSVSTLEMYEDNLVATAMLADAALKKNVLNFVFLSGANIYKPSNYIVNEHSALGDFSTHSAYFLSKIAAEQVLLSTFKNTNVNLCILRVGAPFAVNEPYGKVMSTFFNLAKNAKPIRITADPDYVMNCLHISDICSLIYRVIDTRAAGIYNVNSDIDAYSLREIAVFFLENFKQKESLLKIDSSSLDHPPIFPFASIDKAKKELDFRPTPFIESLSKFCSEMAAL